MLLTTPGLQKFWLCGAPHRPDTDTAGSSISPKRLFNLCKENIMSGIVYIVGAVVIIFAVLSFFGLR